MNENNYKNYIKLQKTIKEFETAFKKSKNLQAFLQNKPDPMDKMINESMEQIKILINFFGIMDTFIEESKKNGVVIPKKLEDDYHRIINLTKENF